MIIRAFIALLAVTVLSAAFAASASEFVSPAGRWKTYDEDTSEPHLVVEVYEAKNGTYAAKVVEILAGPDVCSGCKGDRKDKPLLGMLIMWGQAWRGDNVFNGGTFYNLKNGKTYKSEARLLADGDEFEVAGCVGPMCKWQKWTREN